MFGIIVTIMFHNFFFSPLQGWGIYSVFRFSFVLLCRLLLIIIIIVIIIIIIIIISWIYGHFTDIDNWCYPLSHISALLLPFVCIFSLSLVPSNLLCLSMFLYKSYTNLDFSKIVSTESSFFFFFFVIFCSTFS